MTTYRFVSFGLEKILSARFIILETLTISILQYIAAFKKEIMEYNRIVAVTGLGGLYELVSSKSDGGVVRSLEENSKKFVSSRIHNFSHLETIEVYTVKDNVNLSEVFLAMKSGNEPLPDAKADAKTIQAYFETVFPDMDFSRVYSSDMKKMVKWFSILQKNNIEIHTPEADASEGLAESEKKTIKENAKAAPTKAATVKSAPAKKINTPRRMA